MARYGFVWAGAHAAVDEAERLGVDSLWVGGHITFRAPTSEPVARLATLAALSSTLTIGTSIVILPLYPPALLAKQFADLDRWTGGRLVMGIGVGGEYPPEFSACQVPLSERGPRADEAMNVIRRLWTGEQVSHRGPYFPMDCNRIDPPPCQAGGPPIVVAGRREAAMRRAALLGDGWFPYLYSPKRYAASAEAIREMAGDAGRDLAGFRWMVFAFVHVDRDGSRARRDAAAILSRRYGRPMDDLVDRVAVVGDPDQVAATLGEFVDVGVEHVVLAPLMSADETDMMAAIVENVLAPLRGAR